MAKHTRRSPDTLGAEDLQRYFTFLVIERRLSAASMRPACNGIRFLYLNVLDRPAAPLPPTPSASTGASA